MRTRISVQPAASTPWALPPAPPPWRAWACWVQDILVPTRMADLATGGRYGGPGHMGEGWGPWPQGGGMRALATGGRYDRPGHREVWGPWPQGGEGRGLPQGGGMGGRPCTCVGSDH